ncbi:hypothetical protein B0T11DRAFT_85144 [Plectosphaerella cucumerina]|jgi:hypothetical protein|uniref:Uncharacterized protein n=1 Tax=Plectosphaerella cucumerina TaxID=40658 RepID=A0A8K0X4K3_9PEZI|nr:hypothetical protein B0T11DRAFT_85144 [Plectosphaerella cucumerina]
MHAPQGFHDPDFDIFEWHTKFQSCVRYFLDHAQYVGAVQAVAAFVNIRLPFQQHPHPILSSKSVPSSPAAAAAGPSHGSQSTARGAGFPHNLAGAPTAGAGTVSLIPYIRRLVATGFDNQGILHGFFGDDWVAGVGRLHETERRNYLFAAKSCPWLAVKDSYDMPDGQNVPFLSPLREPSETELRAADAGWSEWLGTADKEWDDWMAMQDWVLGPRDPRPNRRHGGGHGGHPGHGGHSGHGGHRAPVIKREMEE